MESEVKVRERPVMLVLAKRRWVRVSEIGAVIGPALQEIYGHLGERGVFPTEAPFIVYHGSPGPDDGPFEIEICAPVGRPVDAPAGWQLTELPGGTFVSTVHAGSYATLGQTYDQLGAWMPANGFRPAGPPREVYLSEPGTPDDEIRTVVEFPVDEAPVAIAASRA